MSNFSARFLRSTLGRFIDIFLARINNIDIACPEQLHKESIHGKKTEFKSLFHWTSLNTI